MDRAAVHTLGRYIVAAALIVALLPRLLDLAGVPRPGRYLPAGSGDGTQLVIDTQTGRAWSRIVPTNRGTTHWQQDEPVQDFPRQP